MISTHQFLGVPADSWTAWGVWATWLTYVLIALIAFVQVRESQRTRREDERLRLVQSREADKLRLAQSREADKLRRAQNRPFVLVDAHFRSIILLLAVRNIGHTAATEVVVSFDDRVEAASNQIGDLAWQDGTLFTSGIRFMAPGRELLFLMDRFPDRAGSDLTMTLTGTVSYQSHDSLYEYSERFVLDLTAYPGALLPEKGLPELVDAIHQLAQAAQIPGVGMSDVAQAVEEVARSIRGDGDSPL